jgi:Protein of unknown function (DUF4244)
MNLIKQLTQRVSRIRARVDAGMTTAEYAVGTVAAVAFAAILYKVVRSAAVQSALSSIVVSALHSV